MHYSWFEPITDDGPEKPLLRQERTRQLTRLDNARIRRVRTPGPRQGGGGGPSLGRAVFFPVVTGEVESERDGVLATWFVPDGAKVTEGERLAQGAIGTQSVDVTAPKNGVVHRLVDQGNAVVQGTPIAFID